MKAIDWNTKEFKCEKQLKKFVKKNGVQFEIVRMYTKGYQVEFKRR